MRAKFLALLLLFSFVAITQSQSEPVNRPTQFVLLSFDNCQELQTWQQVSGLLDELNAQDPNRLRFTFFLSAVGLLSDQNRNKYQNPANLVGSDGSRFPERARRLANGRRFSNFGESNIDFGGDDLTIAKRVAFINRMYTNGNEIASHAVGHFDGTKWTEAMWRQEFQQYNNIIDHVAEINELSGDAAANAKLAFTSDQFRSFRAPYLGGNKALMKVLRDLGYTADSSDPDQNFETNTWPKHYSVDTASDGPWNFGLTWTDVAKRGPSGAANGKLHIPAMDYNYCYRQNNGCDDNDQGRTSAAVRDAQDMLVAYTNAFLKSYNGNRAPVVIGHHFFPYRGGVYNEALLKFARAVCNQPETRCVTFRDLQANLDQMDSGLRSRYQAGEFTKSTYQPSTQDLIGISGNDSFGGDDQ